MDSKMIDLKRTLADIKADKAEMEGDSNPYPYGACISLDTDELDKLGIKNLPTVGDEYNIMAVGNVTAVRMNSYEKSGEERGITIQIKFLQLVHEDEEPGEVETAASENKENKSGVKSVLSNAMR